VIRCDVLIIGGGPAGSSCARELSRSGLRTLILDKQTFPRDKLCGGWITPAVVEELELDLGDYASGRILQPITGFRTSRMGGREIETDYGEVLSYGIRRVEFDDYLLRRACVEVLQGTELKSLERSSGGWIVNGEWQARMIVGAGGHFCPVARLMGANARKEVAVAAQETEFEMTPAQAAGCAVRGEIPELYFCEDMRGYGWVFRKGNVLNIGLGRLNARELPEHVRRFVRLLQSLGRIQMDVSAAMPGHAYLLYRNNQRKIVDDGVLLIGDAAGMAYTQSGEGIRPAIESGLLAAETILAANGRYDEDHLRAYRSKLAARFGGSPGAWVSLGRRIPQNWINSAAKLLLATRWFSRRVILDRWFLHRNEPPLFGSAG
jgi:geranylgeranyl reductase family protein